MFIYVGVCSITVISFISTNVCMQSSDSESEPESEIGEKNGDQLPRNVEVKRDGPSPRNNQTPNSSNNQTPNSSNSQTPCSSSSQTPCSSNSQTPCSSGHTIANYRYTYNL